MSKHLKLNQIIILCSIFFFLLPKMSNAATLFFSPPDNSFRVGDSFIVEIKLDTESQLINVINVDLEYPNQILKIAAIESGGSIVDIWVKDPKEIKDNHISFVGGITGGYKGESGLIGRVVFRAIKEGSGQVKFLSTSQILLNDGSGTEASLNFFSKSYTISAQSTADLKLTSTTHPDQTKWYNNNNPDISWVVKTGSQYSYVLTEDNSITPDNIADQPIENLEFEDKTDGIYYFKIKEKPSGGSWGKTTTYRIMIDTSPPTIDLKVSGGLTAYQGKYFAVFSSKDLGSGVAYYEIKENEENWQKAISPYVLRNQKTTSQVSVKAVDEAGNEKIEIVPVEIKEPISETKHNNLLTIALIIVGGIIIVQLLRRLLRSKNKIS